MDKVFYIDEITGVVSPRPCPVCNKLTQHNTYFKKNTYLRCIGCGSKTIVRRKKKIRR